MSASTDNVIPFQSARSPRGIRIRKAANVWRIVMVSQCSLPPPGAGRGPCWACCRLRGGDEHLADVPWTAQHR
jgi:hypothetical protein